MAANKLTDDRTDRFPVIPITSIQVESSGRSALPETSHARRRRRRGESGVRMRNPFNYLAPKISNGIQRLVKALKSFPQLFGKYPNFHQVKEGVEEEKEMEIGFPTEVKHLTHIGWDGSTTTNLIKSWENLLGPDQLVASPSISMKQFELAMTAQEADQQQHKTGTISVDLGKPKLACEEQQE